MIARSSVALGDRQTRQAGQQRREQGRIIKGNHERKPTPRPNTESVTAKIQGRPRACSTEYAQLSAYQRRVR
jgi:hypothetical protein